VTAPRPTPGHRLTKREVAALPRSKEEAVALDSKYFATRKPCKRGHVGARATSSGDCCACIAERSDARVKSGANAANQRRVAEGKRERGECRDCPSPARPGKSLCEPCAERMNVRTAVRAGELRAAGLCIKCGRHEADAGLLCRACQDTVNGSDALADANSKRRASKKAVGQPNHTAAEMREKAGELGGVCFYVGGEPWEQNDHSLPISWRWPGSDAVEWMLPASRQANCGRGDGSVWAGLLRVVEGVGLAGMNPKTLAVSLARAEEWASIAELEPAVPLEGRALQLVGEFRLYVAALRAALVTFEPSEDVVAGVEFLRTYRRAA
jgi:hypothetical protein